MALLVAGGAFLHGWQRALLWTAAVAIDYAGPAWLTRERLRGLQRVAVAHFAERYGLFVIICLGESVVAIGVGVGTAASAPERRAGARRRPRPAGDRRDVVDVLRPLRRGRQQRLREHEDPVLAAADGYSYIHLVIVAGIIIFAGGVKLVVHNPVQAPMPGPGRLAICGGVAVYLLGLGGFRLRMLGELAPGGWRSPRA